MFVNITAVDLSPVFSEEVYPGEIEEGVGGIVTKVIPNLEID